jgi:Leucine-rich repeat (LRR) protein
MSGNTRVKDLVMASMGLKYLTVNMLSPNLKMIDLSGNKISAVPEELSNLIHLEQLILRNNQLNKLPSKLK